MPNTPPEIAAHFREMGVLDLTGEDGENLGIVMFECSSCGSMIVARTKHWQVHQALPGIEFGS